MKQSVGQELVEGPFWQKHSVNKEHLVLLNPKLGLSDVLSFLASSDDAQVCIFLKGYQKEL